MTIAGVWSNNGKYRPIAAAKTKASSVTAAARPFTVTIKREPRKRRSTAAVQPFCLFYILFGTYYLYRVLRSVEMKYTGVFRCSPVTINIHRTEIKT